MKTLILSFLNIKVEFNYKVIYIKYDGNYQITIQDKRDGIYHLLHYMNDMTLVFDVVEIEKEDGETEHIFNVKCTSFLSYRNGITKIELIKNENPI